MCRCGLWHLVPLECIVRSRIKASSPGSAFMVKSETRYKDDVLTTSSLPSRGWRWLVVVLLFGLSCASYVERVNISVAAELMMPALSLTKSDMALIFNSFLIGYAIFQVPAGWLGDRFGPRLVLGASSFLWGLLTL